MGGLTQLTAARDDTSSADILLGQGLIAIENLQINDANNIELNTTSNLIVDRIDADGNITLQSAGLVINNAFAGEDISLVANSGDIQLNAGVNANSSLNIEGQNITQSQGAALEASGGITLNAEGTINQQASVNSINSDINLIAGQSIEMDASSQISTQAGSISLSAENNINIAALTAQQGGVALTSAQGEIRDINSDNINITAQRFEAHAANGIGTNDAIEMTVNTIMADSQSNQINIFNTQALNVEHIRTNGDINLTVAEGNIVLDNTPDIAFDRTVDDANTPGAIINAA